MFDTTTKRYAFGKDELKALGIKSDVIEIYLQILK